jgi:hypothetical protein
MRQDPTAAPQDVTDRDERIAAALARLLVAVWRKKQRVERSPDERRDDAA